MAQKTTILGAGAFGTSIATLLANNGHEVYLWCYEEKVKNEIELYKENKNYLPKINLNENIHATTSLQEAIKNSKWIFEAIPVKFLRNIVEQSKEFITKEQIIVTLSKGIEQETLLLPTQVIDDILGKNQKKAVLSGPNFAKEIAQNLYTATTISSSNKEISKELLKLLSNSYFKAEISDDFIGVQISGALKNLITLLVGIAIGNKLGENVIAYFITIGLKEIAQICELLGGKKETVYGLSGLGDFILTSTGSLSRNLEIGKRIGKLQLENNFDWENHIKHKTLPEGINTVESIYQLIKKNNLDLPLCRNTYEIIFKQKPIKEFLKLIFNTRKI